MNNYNQAQSNVSGSKGSPLRPVNILRYLDLLLPSTNVPSLKTCTFPCIDSTFIMRSGIIYDPTVFKELRLNPMRSTTMIGKYEILYRDLTIPVMQPEAGSGGSSNQWMGSTANTGENGTNKDCKLIFTFTVH